MFGLRVRLMTFIIAWIATRFMRRLRFPALIIAIVLEILLAATQLAMSRKKQDRNSEKSQKCGQRVELEF